MISEKEVCSVDISRKLKNLHLTQVSKFYWLVSNHSSIDPVLVTKDERKLATEFDAFSAFTMEELMEIIASASLCLRATKNLKRCDTLFFLTSGIPTMKPDPLFPNHTDVDVKAEMIAYLKQNEIIAFPLV